jgi:SAM-dependent methyltransferase
MVAGAPEVQRLSDRKDDGMQTPAERYMVERLAWLLGMRKADSNAPRILNAGAGQSVSIERQLTQGGSRYVCDRLDIEDCGATIPEVGECWRCSISDMQPVSSEHYVAVFSNYVLEHVEEIRKASAEVYRVLIPGGVFLATVPNTSALEFVVARHTPLWLHRLVRGGRGWETQYAYSGIPELLKIFVDNGFTVVEERRWPHVTGYLSRFPVLGALGRLYDKTVETCACTRLMGDVCISLRRPT